jgi:hypothetical protein
MTSLKDLAWLAGLVEGEGSFLYNHRSLVMTLNTTDFDVIDKVARITNSPVRGPYKQHGAGTKPIYRVTTYGAEWPMTLYSMLGIRRQAKIKELLNVWRQSGRKYYKKRRQHYGHDLLNRVATEPRSADTC